jgi:hypothetical protein
MSAGSLFFHNRATVVVIPFAISALAAGIMSSRAAEPGSEHKTPFTFRDVSHEVGLFPSIKGVRAHAGILGDYNGDGWIDFFAGTFQTEESSPSVLFRSVKGKTFEPDSSQPILLRPGRTTGGMFADLDNDGDLDFYVSNNTADAGSGDLATPSYLYRNNGGGTFTDISKESGACPPYGSRSVVPLDLDGDTLLDIVIGGGRYREQGRGGGRILRNLGGLKFRDISSECGLPEGMGGFSCASADVNNDTFPDVFYVYRGGGLLLNNGKGQFTPAAAANAVFAAARSRDEAPYGPCFADVNRDGWLDLVIGQHSERPWVRPVGPHLFLNRGIKNGQVQFEDVTGPAGLTVLPMKCPHVEIRDFDNDGWPDIYVSVFKFAQGQTYPVIYRHLGVRDGMVRFAEWATAVNDFPTPKDRNMGGSINPFTEKMNRERKITYAVAAPCGDYDQDGRMDIFVAEWWAENTSFLLHNETEGGNWLEVLVQDAPGVNRMGIGSRVNVYESGRAGQTSALIGCQEINIGYGFASSQEAMVHFGLGALKECDIEVVLPFQKGVIRREHVKVNQRLTLP